MVTVVPASELRNRHFPNCQLRSPTATVLSLLTTRSVCTVNTQSRSLRAVRRKRRAFLGRHHGEPLVELGYIAICQKSVRALQIADAGQAQFLRQPSLPGAKIALTTASRLR